MADAESSDMEGGCKHYKRRTKFVAHDPAGKCDLFARHFSSVFTKSDIAVPSFDYGWCSSFNHIKVSATEVEKKLEALDPNKSAGPDNIPSLTPCCQKVYTCRFCHDENESHPLNRKDVTELVCGNCCTRQKVQAECEKCSLRFGKYTCLECKLFDDEDKNQYHCEGCGICRIGGRDKFFHCAKCNMCLPIKLQNGHKCVENVSRANCPVCLEDIHTSRIPCHIPDCGHLLHRTCFEDLLQSGLYTCPTCQTSLVDMTPVWEHYDTEIQMTPMPPEFKDYIAEILCKDCQKYSTIPYHVVGLKCKSCGSYNTTRTKTLRSGNLQGASSNNDEENPGAEDD